MTSLSSDLHLSQLSLPGTHESAATSSDYVLLGQCQLMSISNQLTAGIRVLDIRLATSGYSGSFGQTSGLELWHGPINENLTFDTVLNEVQGFLWGNPDETVVMRVDNEENDSTATFVSAFSKYWSKNGNLFWNPANSTYPLNPTLGEMRGKIVVLDDFSKTSPSTYGIYYGSLNAQDNYGVNSQSDLYAKWKEVELQLGTAIAFHQIPNNQTLFINYLSGVTPAWQAAVVNSSIVFPYFVASGQYVPYNGQPLEFLGIEKESYDPDFPHDACAFSLCTVTYEGTNGLANNYLANDYPTIGSAVGLGMIMADFPGPALIGAVILKNAIAPAVLPILRAEVYGH